VVSGVIFYFNGFLFEVVLEVGSRYFRLLEESLVVVKVLLEIIKNNKFFVEAYQGILEVVYFTLEFGALTNGLLRGAVAHSRNKI
jgi:hypothetical protein